MRKKSPLLDPNSDRELLKQSLILLGSFNTNISKRRHIEEAVGYPREYGGDSDLLRESRLFMGRPAVREIIMEILKERGHVK